MSSIVRKSYEVFNFQNIVNLMVSVSEAVAWAAFGVNPLIKSFFVVWALVMVYARPFLAQAELVAVEDGNEKLASRIRLYYWITIVVTGISLFSLYSDALEKFKQQRIAESAGVRLAQVRYDEVKERLDVVLASYDESAVMSAIGQKEQLSSQLNHLISAQASQIKAFWNKTHTNGLKYSQIMTEDCTPKHSQYGLMRTAASEICAELPKNGKVDSVAHNIKSLEATASQKVLVDGLKRQLSEAEQALILAQQESGSSSQEIFPVVFHRMSSLTSFTGFTVEPEIIMSVFGVLVILVVLNLQGILKVTHMSINGETKKKVGKGECANCGKTFDKETRWQKYCCDACRQEAMNDGVATHT